MSEYDSAEMLAVFGLQPNPELDARAEKVSKVIEAALRRALQNAFPTLVDPLES